MIHSTLDRLAPEQRAIAAQIARYGVAGGLITLAVAASYWALAEYGGFRPMISFTIVFLFFSLVSYVTHGAFSFRGHGTRDRHHVRASRFVAVNLVGFALNQGFIWLLVHRLDGPTWWPTVPMVLVTPLVTFALHRRYVYA